MSRRVLKKAWLPLALLIIVSMLATAACAEKETREIKYPNIFSQATFGDVDSLDPAYLYDTASGEQVQAIYETLIYYDGESTSKFVGVLATEWSISDDGKTYRFKIRKGAKFHDGGDLTPEDVEYSFERGMVQDYQAGPQAMIFEPLLGVRSSRDGDGNLAVPLDDIKGAIEVDDDWVQFNLVEPYAPFLQILCGTWGSIVDKEWCIAQGDWDGTQASYEELNNPAANDTPLNAKTNGTGPFKLERWDPGIEIVLVRNDEYWGKKASFELFITKNIEEWPTRKLMLQNGEVDYAEVPRANIQELEGYDGIRVYKDLPELMAVSMFFNFEVDGASQYLGSGKLDGNGIPTDFFGDRDVRLGFNYVFDYDTFVEDAYLGEASRIASPAIAGLPYGNPKQEKYNYNLDKAEEHLRIAWNGQVWDKGFKLVVAYNSGNEMRKTACDILKDGLEEMNPKFQITVQPLEWSTYLDQAFSGMIPMFVLGWQADYPDPHSFFLPFMHSQGDFPLAQSYSNAEADELIEEGIRATDPDRRKQIYYQLQEIYHEDAPGVILVQPLGRRYFRDWVQGFVYNPVDPGEISHVYYLSKEY